MSERSCRGTAAGGRATLGTVAVRRGTVDRGRRAEGPKSRYGGGGRGGTEKLSLDEDARATLGSPVATGRDHRARRYSARGRDTRFADAKWRVTRLRESEAGNGHSAPRVAAAADVSRCRVSLSAAAAAVPSLAEFPPPLFAP